MLDLMAGFAHLFSDGQAVFFTFLAAFVGIIFGALPGLTASAAIAMLLPLSFHLGPLQALAFLYVIGKSGRYGGSIAAILFNTPGTAASAATMQDGYPMTQRGEAGKALKTATLASIVGDYIGEIILIFGAVLIGVFLIHGIQVGPAIFDTPYSRQLIYSLFAAGLLGIAAYGAIGYWFGPYIGKMIAYLPTRLLYPFIFVTAIAASYSSRASILDVAVALLFGIIGYAMRRTEFSAAAFVIAFVLAKNMEEAFRQALLLSDNGLLIFVTEPVAASFLAVGFAVMIYRSISVMRHKRKLPDATPS